MSILYSDTTQDITGYENISTEELEELLEIVEAELEKRSQELMKEYD